MNNPHRYSIRPLDPRAHLFEVRLTVVKPDEAGQVFATITRGMSSRFEQKQMV